MKELVTDTSNMNQDVLVVLSTLEADAVVSSELISLINTRHMLVV